MPRLWEDLNIRVKDVAYVTVGLGIMSFQKLQVQRRELEKNLRATAERTRETVDGSIQLVSERLRG